MARELGPHEGAQKRQSPACSDWVSLGAAGDKEGQGGRFWVLEQKCSQLWQLFLGCVGYFKGVRVGQPIETPYGNYGVRVIWEVSVCPVRTRDGCSGGTG